MAAHVLAITIASLVRALLEFGVGLYTLSVCAGWDGADASAQGWFQYHSGAEPIPGDRLALTILGCCLVAIGAVRLFHALGAFSKREWARKIGVFLAVLDIITPITIFFALWGWIVWRHPETRDLFGTSGQPQELATGEGVEPLPA